MCHRHGSNQNSHPPVLVRKPLCNQFIYYPISSRWVFGINRFKLCNFAVVAIEYSFATVYRGSIMAKLSGVHCKVMACLGKSVSRRIWETLGFPSLSYFMINYGLRMSDYVTDVCENKVSIDLWCFIISRNDIYILPFFDTNFAYCVSLSML